MTLNQERTKHYLRRGLISDSVLKLLSRADGLDILLSGEQSEYTYATPDLDDHARVSGLISDGYSLVSFDPFGNKANMSKLDHINYPVPGYTGYDLS